jgi:hypothetical protein
MKMIKVGDVYKKRNGDSVTIVKIKDKEKFPRCVVGEFKYSMSGAKGRLCYTLDGLLFDKPGSPHDLILEDKEND